ncbi:MAG: hypothetical protein ACXABN_01125 [Candidatus Thorarchaeota archaeon]
MRKRLLTSILVLSFFLVSMTWVPTVPHWGTESSARESKPEASPTIQDINELTPIDELIPEGVNQYKVADIAPADGVLDPASIEQIGYMSSGNQTALTDKNPNVGYDFPIDDAHDWMGSNAEVDIWNLKKTFVSNGTFDEGVAGINEGFASGVQAYPYGWNTWGYSPDDKAIQRTGYIADDRKYVMMEAEGDMIGTGVNYRAQHTAGTLVQFNQTIVNAPYSESFVFEFDYLYVRGPLGLPAGQNISLVARADGVVVWSTNLADLAQRNQWYSTGRVEFNKTGMSQTFLFQLALEVPFDLQIYVVDHGIINAAYFTVHVDDVVFDGALTPGFDQVDLLFNAGAGTTPLTGTAGTGSASIFNSSYWKTAPLTTTIIANTTVSYDYRIRLKTHRFTNTTWTTESGLEGTSYSVSLGESSQLSFYAYLGFLGDYENLTQTFRFPSDWANATVLDPFTTSVTGLCNVSSGQIVIPTSIMNRLGWWEVKLESPNYAKSIKSQILDGSWAEASPAIFRISNSTRTDITIGTETQTLGSLTDVNVTWFNPSDAIWNTELISGGSLGQIYSSSHVFNSGSSPAGEWWVEVYWTNGTEVAYARARFEVHHSALLIGDPVEISTDTGLTVSGLVRYSDGDTGTFLMDGTAVLVANWSGGDVTFVPNPIQNWWEGDFDTSLSGEGDFVVVVNATRPYYDDISCQIMIHSVKVTRLNSPDAPWAAAEWGDSVPLIFNFESYNFGTELWGPIANESDISVSANWTAGYWTIAEDVTPGVFILTLDTSVRDVGTWLLNTTFSKPFHESKTVLLTLIVSPTANSLSILEGISARVDLDESYPLTLRFQDHVSVPIIGANVIVDSISPPIGLDHTPVVEVGGEPGNYSVTITPRDAGVYTVRFVSSKQNFENATAVFVLVVNDVATHLDIPGTGSVEIGLTDVHNTTIRFEMFNGTGVPGAQINVTYTGGTVDALTWGLAEIGLGDYSIEFSSTASGTYLVTIAGFKPYHQSDSDAFFLVVREITANMTSLNGSIGDVGFGNDYRVFLSYQNNTGHGLVGANVSIEDVKAGLIWAPTVAEAPGVYSILLTPLISSSFVILIQASLPNHQTAFVFFTLTVSPIQTTLTVNASKSISLDQSFSVYLFYQDDAMNALENSTMGIQTLPDNITVAPFEELGSGYYRALLSPHKVGAFDIVFFASKDGYQTDYATFTLTATRVPTELFLVDGLSSGEMTYSEQLDVDVIFERTDTNENVDNAALDFQTTPTTGLTFTYLPQGGIYVITIDPERVGNWTIEISASRTNYTGDSVVFLLEVNPIAITYNLPNGLTVVEGVSFDIIIELNEVGTGIPIDGADVKYRFSDSETGVFRNMQPTGLSGEYFVSISLQLYSNSRYILEIIFEKDNYVLTEIDVIFSITPSPLQWILPAAGVTVFAISLFVILGSMRIYTRRKRERIEIDVMNKRRFEDADNIIGVIVMHKSSGIPIYSRIVKGGFEEGIVAAFISAVTHFREEFDAVDVEAMTVIPISDIIRAVQTRNLICAFITLRSASVEHNRKMESFGQQVATYLDDFYTESRPTSTLDQRITEIIDYVYDETMDGDLIKFYKAASDKQFPRRLKFVEQLLEEIDSRHCSRPIYLARGVATYGVSEARGCTLVLEAMEKGIITQCEEHEPSIEDMEFKDFFEKKNEKGEA